MKLLLDSHALVWWLTGDRRLRPAAREAIESRPVAVSLASCWELGNAQAAGRLPISDDLFDAVQANGFVLEAVTVEDVRAATRLSRGRSDPFDRMLVAQAARRGLVVVTADPKLRELGAAVLPA